MTVLLAITALWIAAFLRTWRKTKNVVEQMLSDDVGADPTPDE
jgi:hypothetical protein